MITLRRKENLCIHIIKNKIFYKEIKITFKRIIFAGFFINSILGVLSYLRLASTTASTGDSSFIEYVNAEHFVYIRLGKYF
jgi:hypothetical protein